MRSFPKTGSFKTQKSADSENESNEIEQEVEMMSLDPKPPRKSFFEIGVENKSGSKNSTKLFEDDQIKDELPEKLFDNKSSGNESPNNKGQDHQGKNFVLEEKKTSNQLKISMNQYYTASVNVTKSSNSSTTLKTVSKQIEEIDQKKIPRINSNINVSKNSEELQAFEKICLFKNYFPNNNCNSILERINKKVVHNIRKSEKLIANDKQLKLKKTLRNMIIKNTAARFDKLYGKKLLNVPLGKKM